MVLGNSSYVLPQEEALDTTQYKTPDLDRSNIFVGNFGYRENVASSYSLMTSREKGPLNYTLTESGGVGQGYGHAEGGNALGGGGGREIFT
jgi:hypothetical protein